MAAGHYPLHYLLHFCVLKTCLICFRSTNMLTSTSGNMLSYLGVPKTKKWAWHYMRTARWNIFQVNEPICLNCLENTNMPIEDVYTQFH